MLSDILKNPPPLPLVQGPLAGYTHAAFRRQVWRWGNPMWAVSEMIPANIIVQNPNLGAYRLIKHPEEGPLVYQLSGNCPTTVGEASHYLSEHKNAAGLDLNAGCPKKKIRKKGCGSALLEAPERLYQVASSMRPYTPFLTVKIRIDHSGDDYTNDVIEAVSASGADALIMHARSWQETDEVACHWDRAAALIAACKIPVIINGNLTDRDTIEHYLKHTGAKGAMIARGSCGRPWLIGQMQQKTINSTDCYQSLMTHLLDTETLVGAKKAFLQSQSLLRYYERHLPLLKQTPWRECLMFDERLLRLKRAFFGHITQ